MRHCLRVRRARHLFLQRHSKAHKETPFFVVLSLRLLSLSVPRKDLGASYVAMLAGTSVG